LEGPLAHIGSGYAPVTHVGPIKRSNDPLAQYGICRYPDPYTREEIASFNAAMDPLLASRIAERRAYVHVSELQSLGLLDRLFSPAMRNILFSIMPDPVLYHCHVYEIAANDTRSHIFSESLSGWHRDPDSELVAGEVTHVSIFVYLTDVGPEDGAFEFSPNEPTGWLHSSTPRISVTGAAGFTFGWQRSFYHRASPNRGPVRRRLFKISVQRNRFRSRHLANPHFRELLAAVPPGDTAMDVLLGRFQGSEAPAIPGIVPPPSSVMPPTGRLDIPNKDLLTAQLRERARKVKARLKGDRSEAENAAYD
jgi:hypothetical protein